MATYPNDMSYKGLVDWAQGPSTNDINAKTLDGVGLTAIQEASYNAIVECSKSELQEASPELDLG